MSQNARSIYDLALSKTVPIPDLENQSDGYLLGP